MTAEFQVTSIDAGSMSPLGRDLPGRIAHALCATNWWARAGISIANNAWAIGSWNGKSSAGGDFSAQLAALG